MDQGGKRGGISRIATIGIIRIRLKGNAVEATSAPLPLRAARSSQLATIFVTFP